MNFRTDSTVCPGDDSFLVINQGYDTEDDRFRPAADNVSFNGSWTYRS